MGDVNLRELTGVVTALETVVASAKALIEGFAAEVEAHKDDPIAIQAVVDRIRATSDDLSAAVVANTPAA